MRAALNISWPLLDTGTTVSAEPEIRLIGQVTLGIAATADGFVSAAAKFASALTRLSTAAARMLAPPPMEWPLNASASVSMRWYHGDAGLPSCCSSHVSEWRRSLAKFWWLGKNVFSDSVAMTK